MFALLTWCGFALTTKHDEPHEDINLFKAYAKLSNKFLGYLKVPKVGNYVTYVELLRIFRDLQAQGSQLLKHAFRPKEHLVLDFGTFNLSLTYTDHVSKTEEELFCKSLYKTSLRVDLYWDEDDTQALLVLNRHYVVRNNCLSINIGWERIDELRVLAWTTSETQLHVYPGVDDTLSFIAHFKHIEHLELCGSHYSRPNSMTKWVQYIPPSVKKLVLASPIYDTSNLHTLTSLEYLCVPFKDFHVKKLPPNLVELTVHESVFVSDSLRSKLHPTCKLTLYRGKYAHLY
jgi:hypothetical protein